MYPRAIGADLSGSRFERYFRAEDDQVRIINDIRDRLVFAAHNLLRDPPFSRLHLISCRNLLIYLGRELQEQVMGVFRYACRDRAFLFLGASESADEELFEPADRKHRIFRTRPRADGERPSLPDILAAPSGFPRHGRELTPADRRTNADAHLAALEEMAPPTVLVDERGHVLHLSPSVSRFFQQGGGPPARRITELVRRELRDELSLLLHGVTERPGPLLSPFVDVVFNGGPHRVAVLAQPRPPGKDGRRAVLLTFLDGGESTAERPAVGQEPTNELVSALRERLRQAELRVEGLRDDRHVTNEDLRAANEELQSLNEEYRSTTEELETSKEELQSINEELHTVNPESGSIRPTCRRCSSRTGRRTIAAADWDSA